jgi:hypothetical protein
VRRVALLFVAGLALSGITALEGVQPNDEGLMLKAAARIADGQVPYRDFWWFYPPGQPYLLAALWELAGPSLVAWRVVRILANATVAALVYLLARRGASERWALVAWLVALLAMAYPTGPHPFPIALACALGALALHERHPVWAGVLTGACAAWRVEFAVALGAGIALGHVDHRRYVPAAIASAVALYAPVVVAAGLGPSWDLLVDYPLTDFRDYQTLPFPLAYDGPLDTSSMRGFVRHSLEPLLLHYLPLVLVVGLLAILADGGWRRERRPYVVFAGGALAYLLVRPDLFHTAPLAVMVAVLGAWTASASPRRALAWAAAGVLAYAAVEGLDRQWLVLRDDTRRLELPVADGVRVPLEDARELEEVVASLDGRRFYVLGMRGDRVTAGHPLLYVLAGSPNPTRYDIAAPGVVTSEPVQREIVADLERQPTPFVVRWLDPVTAAPEPNLAGRELGSRLLDQYLARSYRAYRRVGSFLILERRVRASPMGREETGRG